MICRHFGSCGGCLYQDMPAEAYRVLKRQSVATALQRFAIETDLRDIVEVPPATRRRAALKAKMSDGVVALGFHAARLLGAPGVALLDSRLHQADMVALLQR